eukprot:gene29241-35297_t
MPSVLSDIEQGFSANTFEASASKDIGGNNLKSHIDTSTTAGGSRSEKGDRHDCFVIVNKIISSCLALFSCCSASGPRVEHPCSGHSPDPSSPGEAIKPCSNPLSCLGNLRTEDFSHAQFVLYACGTLSEVATIIARMGEDVHSEREHEDDDTAHYTSTYVTILTVQMGINITCALLYAILVGNYILNTTDKRDVERTSNLLQAGFMIFPWIILIGASMLEFYAQHKTVFLFQALTDLFGYAFTFSYWYWHIKGESGVQNVYYMCSYGFFFLFMLIIIVKNLTHEAEMEYNENETGYVYSITEVILVFEFVHLWLDHLKLKNRRYDEKKNKAKEILKKEREEKKKARNIEKRRKRLLGVNNGDLTESLLINPVSGVKEDIKEGDEEAKHEDTESDVEGMPLPTAKETEIKKKAVNEHKRKHLLEGLCLVLLFVISELITYTLRAVQPGEPSDSHRNATYTACLWLQVGINFFCLVMYFKSIVTFKKATDGASLLELLKRGPVVQMTVMALGFLGVGVVAFVGYSDNATNYSKLGQFLVDIFGYPFLFLYWALDVSGRGAAEGADIQEPYLYIAGVATMVFLFSVGIADLYHGSDTSYKDDKTQYISLQLEFIMIFEFMHLVVERMIHFVEARYGSAASHHIS